MKKPLFLLASLFLLGACADPEPLLVIIPGIGIYYARKELGDYNLLHIAHAFHDFNRNHTIERTPQAERIITDAVLDTNGVKHSTLGRVNNPVGINHLDEQADKSRLLCLVKINDRHSRLL